MVVHITVSSSVFVLLAVRKSINMLHINLYS